MEYLIFAMLLLIGIALIRVGITLERIVNILAAMYLRNCGEKYVK